MPHPLSVKLLSEICVDFIKDNMSKFCEMSSMRRPAGVDAFNAENSLSPFDSLPSVILEGIIRHLTLSNQLKEKYLELLITPYLRTLDFSMCDKHSISGLLRLASRKCPHLRSLWLGSLGYFLGCLNFIPKFTHLQVLDISGSGTADSLLSLLGTYCPDLKELYINDSLVSDAGIKGLCVTGQCKSICILHLSETNVTFVGTAMALKNLPSLKELRHDSIVDTLARLYQMALREGRRLSDVKYALSTLTIRINSPYERGDLPEALFLCPSLTKLDITAPEVFTDRDLLALLPQEKKITDLTLSGTQTSRISFNGGVAPLFRQSVIGISLTSLNLSYFPKVNIRIITEYCPNLRSLILDKIDRYEEFHHRPENPVPKILMKLEILKLVHFNSQENLFLLLSSPSLVSVTLDHCYALTDNVLKSVTELHSFRNLEHFHVISNFRLTKNGIDYLMKETNPLKVIKLKNITCLTETDMDMEEWKKKIRDENWQLSLTIQGRF